MSKPAKKVSSSIGSLPRRGAEGVGDFLLIEQVQHVEADLTAHAATERDVLRDVQVHTLSHGVRPSLATSEIEDRQRADHVRLAGNRDAARRAEDAAHTIVRVGNW